VPPTACRSLEFHRATEVINIGHTLARTALDEYEADLATDVADA
jgi:NTE family protein